MTMIRDENIEAYHRNPAVSNSKLSVFRESPLLYWKTYVTTNPAKRIARADTKALRRGKGFDCLKFDGRPQFNKLYIARPETYPSEDGESKPWHGSANYCRSWEKFQSMTGKTVLPMADVIAFEHMLIAMNDHAAATALLSQGEPQVTIRRHSDKFDLDVQVRPDWFSQKPISIPEIGLESDGLPYFVDLKTTADWSDWFDPIDPEDPRGGSPVWKYGYHRQGGFVQWVGFQDIGRTAHFLVVVESREPFRVGVVRLHPDYLDIGWAAVSADLQRLRACQIADKWPGSVERVVELRPPEWLDQKAGREMRASLDAGAVASEMVDLATELTPAVAEASP